MSNWFEDNVVVNGEIFHYTRTGGDKPPLVLAHGFSDNGLCWTPIAKALEADFDVIMPDARGHGQSQRLRPDETLAMEIDLAHLIRALDLHKPIVLGHSMGAGTAASLAAKFPDLPGAILLEDPPWRPSAGGVSHSEFGAWMIEMQKTKTVADVVAHGRAENPNWPETEYQPWGESKMQLDLTILQIPFPDYSRWREVAAKIACPALLITGDPELGALVTPETAQTATEINQRIQLAHIPGAGHSIHRDQPQAYLAAVKSFLNNE